MKKEIVMTALLTFGTVAFAQVKDKGVFIEPSKKNFFEDVIKKDIRRVDDSLAGKGKTKLRFSMDQSSMKLPDQVSLYKSFWANPVISQGDAGTCWDFSTTSMYESEIYRITGRKVKLSEMYTAYWEYVEKARRFVRERGNSLFDQGSESNAVARIIRQYGVVPQSEYTGLKDGRVQYTHTAMFNEMESYLNSVKVSNAWNEEQVLSTIQAILTHYMGAIPTRFTVDGKEFTPQSYASDLKINPDDYVEILSYKQKPYWQKVQYEVPDNWWKNEDYYNVPLDDFMKALKQAIRNGYTMSIGGDVSEIGLNRENHCALIPDFDIPSAYINEDARQFRFSNGTTADDHGMHLVGYLENYKNTGKDWYLVKDSGSGTRNGDAKVPEFGYYFFSEDYVKLKMMDFTVHKDAVKELLKKFK